MISEIGKYLRAIRIRTDESLRTMATKLGISASYLSAIENGKRNLTPDFLETIFKAYSISNDEKEAITKLVYKSINNYKINLSHLNEKERQVLISVAKENLDDSTIDKLYEIVSDDSNKKTEKL